MVNNIIVNGVEIIEHFASGCLNGIRLALALVAFRVDDHFNAFGNDIDIDVCTCQYRLAVEMDRSSLGAMNMQMPCAESLYARTLV